MSANLIAIIRSQEKQIEAQRRTIRDLQGYAPPQPDLTRAQSAILAKLNRYRWTSKEALAEAAGLKSPVSVETHVSRIRKAGVTVISRRFQGYRLARVREDRPS